MFDQGRLWKIEVQAPKGSGHSMWIHNGHELGHFARQDMERHTQGLQLDGQVHGQDGIAYYQEGNPRERHQKLVAPSAFDQGNIWSFNQSLLIIYVMAFSWDPIPKFL